MKKLGLFLIFVLHLAMVASCTNATDPTVELTPIPTAVAPDTSDVLRIAAGEWSPFRSETLDYEGVLSRIAREAFALDGIKVEFVYLPWQRSMDSAKAGQYHGTFPWLKTEEREQDFYFSDPITDEDIVFFYRADSGFDWETIEDLKNRSIGGTQGYFYGNEFAQLEKNGELTIKRVSENKLNFEKLKAGRVDLVIAEINLGYGLVEELFTPEEAQGITHHPKPVESSDPQYILSRKVAGNEQLIQQFQSESSTIDGKRCA